MDNLQSSQILRKGGNPKSEDTQTGSIIGGSMIDKKKDQKHNTKEEDDVFYFVETSDVIIEYYKHQNSYS